MYMLRTTRCIKR